MLPNDDNLRSLVTTLGSRIEALIITPDGGDHVEHGAPLSLFLEDGGFGFSKNSFRLYIDDCFFFQATHSWLKQDDIQWLRSKLQHELSNTRYAIRTISWESWRANRAEYQGSQHWLHLLLGLVQQLESWKIKLDSGRLIQILELAARDAKRSYQLLAAAFQRALAQREGRLQQHLRLLGRVLMVLYSLLHLSYSVRNLICSQRSWFLHHGAHPSELSTPTAQGCF
jgi:hypothetical protein